MRSLARPLMVGVARFIRNPDCVQPSESLAPQLRRRGGEAISLHSRRCNNAVGRPARPTGRCALGLSTGAPQLSAEAIFPERALLDQPGERVASLAEARERAERLHIEEAMRQTGAKSPKLPACSASLVRPSGKRCEGLVFLGS